MTSSVVDTNARPAAVADSALPCERRRGRGGVAIGVLKRFVLLAIVVGVLTPASDASGQGCRARWIGDASTTASLYNAVIAVLPDGDAILGRGSVYPVARLHNGAVSSLGAGVRGSVRALLVMPNGDVIAGGENVSVGSESGGLVLRWNGAAWNSLGLGPYSAFSVLALARMPGGDVIAGGYFNAIGGVSSSNIARWNGSVWSPIGSGLNGSVTALAVLPNGDLIAAGYFTAAGSVGANRIARWNGTFWTALGAGLGSTDVSALAAMPNGDIVVVGGALFGVPGNYIARWNGSSWSTLGGGLDNYAATLAVRPNGDLIVGGDFRHAGGVASMGIARWNGAAWSPLGAGADAYVPSVVALANGDILAVGSFRNAGLTGGTYGLARYTFGTTCPADFNCSAALEVQDIFEFM